MSLDRLSFNIFSAKKTNQEFYGCGYEKKKKFAIKFVPNNNISTAKNCHQIKHLTYTSPGFS
jgi:hypothetical protein